MQALAHQPALSVPPLLDIHALAGVQRARCLLALARPDEARTQLDAAMRHARQACVPMDLIQNLFWVADCECRLGCVAAAAVLLDEMVALAEAQALPHYRIAGLVCRLGLAAPAQRDLARMGTVVQQLLASGERWCDAKLLALLAEARHALAQAESVLEGMPVHTDEVARARERVTAPHAAV